MAEVKSFGLGAREVSSLYPDPSLGLRKLAEHNILSDHRLEGSRALKLDQPAPTDR
jgi:hypothetical protein